MIDNAYKVLHKQKIQKLPVVVVFSFGPAKKFASSVRVLKKKLETLEGSILVVMRKKVFSGMFPQVLKGLFYSNSLCVYVKDVEKIGIIVKLAENFGLNFLGVIINDSHYFSPSFLSENSRFLEKKALLTVCVQNLIHKTFSLVSLTSIQNLMANIFIKIKQNDNSKSVN